MNPKLFFKEVTFYAYLRFTCQIDFKMATDNTVELYLVFRSYQYFCIFLKNGTEDVKCHKWFKAIDWNLVYQRKLKVSGLVSNNNY